MREKYSSSQVSASVPSVKNHHHHHEWRRRTLGWSSKALPLDDVTLYHEPNVLRRIKLFQAPPVSPLASNPPLLPFHFSSSSSLFLASSPEEKWREDRRRGGKSKQDDRMTTTSNKIYSTSECLIPALNASFHSFQTSVWWWSTSSSSSAVTFWEGIRISILKLKSFSWWWRASETSWVMWRIVL